MLRRIKGGNKLKNRLSGGVACVMTAIVTVIAFSGCKDPGSLNKKVSIKIDPAMKARTVRILKSDIKKMLKMKFKDASSGEDDVITLNWYKKVFGGDSAVHALKFLDERINYVVPDGISLNDRVRVIQPSLAAVTMASNIGMALWFLQKTYEPKRLLFKLGKAEMPLESSRIGIIKLGEGYLLGRINGIPLNPIVRSGILVHEARHSDCTGGIWKSDIERLKSNQLPENKMCGHLHVMCPEGHTMAGLPACDAQPWGAYSIAGIYYGRVAKKCMNCSEREKQIAQIHALEQFSRVMPIKEMLDGKTAQPDMSSSTRVMAADAVVELKKFRSARKADVKAGEIEIIGIE